MDEIYDGFGASSQRDIKELSKALSVGYGVSPSTQEGFGATRLESLEMTLKYAVAEEKTAKFWKELAKTKAKSTVEEFTSLVNIGSAGFYVEGGLPEEYDEEIKREFETIKYIGAVGKVPNVAQTVRSMSNNMQLVQKAKATAIIRSCDVKTFFGNSANISVEWNGILSQVQNRVKNASENIIDLRGHRLTPEDMNKVGNIIEGNYGDPGNIKGWIGVKAFNDYVDGLLGSKQLFLGNGATSVDSIRVKAKHLELANTVGDIETDLFLRHRGETHLDDKHPKMNSAKTVFSATSAKAPATLNVGTCSCIIDNLVGSLLPAGTYDYAVVPINKYGAGAAFELTGKVVIADKKVVFTLADNGSVTGQEASAFEIYRKLSSSTSLTDYRYLKTVTASAVKEDVGADVPDTTYGFFFDWNFDQVVTFKQLLPMVKMPLATIDDSIRWLQKLYGTPIVFNPNKVVIFKNIGTL